MRDWTRKAVLASRSLRLAAHLQKASAAVLMYHSVLPDPAMHSDLLGGISHSEVTFRGQMELLARDYQPLSLNILMGCLQRGEALPKRSVAITFDDGYRDNVEFAMPILNRLGISATFYLIVDCVENRALPWPSRLRFAFRNSKAKGWCDHTGKDRELDTRGKREEAFNASCEFCCRLTGNKQHDFVLRVEEALGIDTPQSSLMMTYGQAKELIHRGHSVGSHTMSHPNMAFVEEDEGLGEFTESKQLLTARLNTVIRHFAYPAPALSPNWNEQTVTLCRKAGYESAVTTNNGLVHSGDNPLHLKRIRPTKTVEGLRWNLEKAFAGRIA